MKFWRDEVIRKRSRSSEANFCVFIKAEIVAIHIINYNTIKFIYII